MNELNKKSTNRTVKHSRYKPICSPYVPIMIHAYKYNGWLYRSLENVFLIHETNDYLLVYLPTNRTCSIKSEENTDRFFYYQNEFDKYWLFLKNTWFNVIINVFKDDFSFYVNIASPFIWEERAIKYIDFDLDFKIRSDNSFNLVDEMEYLENSTKWRYPEHLKQLINETKQEIIYLIENKWFKRIFNLQEKLAANEMVRIWTHRLEQLDE